KITRLAFSVYRSNIFPHPDVPSHLCRKHLSILLAYVLRTPPERKLFCPASALRHEGATLLRRTNPPSAKSAEKPKTCSLALLLIQRSGRHFLSHAMMQPQHAITSARKLKVVGDD